MVVDDAPEHLELIRAALASEDVEILTATTAESALEQFEKTRTRIVLSDLVLPGMSGMDLLDKILARDPGVEFILMTGRRFSCRSASTWAGRAPPSRPSTGSALSAAIGSGC